MYLLLLTELMFRYSFNKIKTRTMFIGILNTIFFYCKGGVTIIIYLNQRLIKNFLKISFYQTIEGGIGVEHS